MSTFSGELQHQPEWDADAPPTDDELQNKFRWLAGEVLDMERVQEVETAVWQLPDQLSVENLVTLLAAPPDKDLAEPR